ncbi:IPT/TIG domain-containing protein [Bacteroides sp. 51]|uniref:IPT/TIG domain-containing protein n=1 Tax=Bacteroides sp. 51 TaxID=2302938 RepID=UPI0013CF6A49|nr:IPT/TIG domain-containing protein [Bacteroides sp. 51]NDV82553.1 hypothetical protein [Bacteroides sp. 51]
MKSIFLYLTTIFLIISAGIFVTACSDDKEENQSERLSIKVYSPTKIVQGQEVIISGTGLDVVTSVVFPGEIRVTSITVISANQISVIAPAGISAAGGGLVLYAGDESVVSPVPVTLGNPEVTSISPSDTIRTGSEFIIIGTDMEFFHRAIFPGTESNDVVVEAIDFERKSTGSLRIKVPIGAKEGSARIRLITISGVEVVLPEVEIAAPAGGSDGPVEIVVWEGEHTIDWGGNAFHLKAEWFEDAAVGQKVRLYFQQLNAWNQFLFNNGSWEKVNMPELGGGDAVTTDNLGGVDVTEFEFTITEELLDPWFLTDTDDALIFNGDGFVFNKVVHIK